MYIFAIVVAFEDCQNNARNGPRTSTVSLINYLVLGAMIDFCRNASFESFHEVPYLSRRLLRVSPAIIDRLVNCSPE